MSISPPFAESTILSVGKTILSLARDHQAALERGGLSVQRIDQLETDLQALDAAPTAKATNITLQSHTGAKDEALDACYLWGRALEQKIIDRFGEDSAEASLFPESEFVSALHSERRMLVVMPTLFSLIDELGPGLGADGDLETFRSEGAAALETLQNEDLAQELYKVEKGEQARHRQILRRRIFDTVNDITRTGRRVYRREPEKRDLFRSPWPYSSPANGGSSELEEPEEQNQ